MAATEESPTSTDRRVVSSQIMAEFHTFLSELRCVGGDRMRRAGVSMSHFHIIAMLDRHGEMAMSRIAELLDVSLSNATGVVDRLEERGLAERVRVPDDRRIVLVRMTELGRKTLTEMEVLKNELVQKVLDQLTPAQLGHVAVALEDIRAGVQRLAIAEPDWKWHDHVAGHDHHRPHDTLATSSNHQERMG